MSSTSAFASYNLLGSLGLPNRHRSHAPVVGPFCLHLASKASVNQGLFLFSSINRGGRGRRTIKMDLNVVNNIQPGAPIPSGNPFPSGWTQWILLAAIPLILPFFKSKWGPLLAIKQKVDTTLEMADDIAEAIEGVAKTIDHVADEIVDKLPEGSKIKDTIRYVDRVAENIIKGADITEELIDKVEEVEKKVEDLVEEVDQAKVTPKS